MLVKSSNCTFDFIKGVCHDNLSEEKNKQGRVYIFQDTLLESFQIHQLALMYSLKVEIVVFIQVCYYKFFLNYFFVPAVYISNIFHV